MADRTYSEREIADLIARAAGRQQAASDRQSETGLTLGELEEVGRETGIAPEHLRAAAVEMDAAERSRGDSVLGVDVQRVDVERWVDAPLTPQIWEDAVSHLRTGVGQTSTGAGGTVQQVGRAYEWQDTSGLQVTTVTASPRDGRTRLQLRQVVSHASPESEGTALGALVGLFVSVFAAMGADVLGGSAVAIWLTLLLSFAAAWAISKPIITRHRRGKNVQALDRLDVLTDSLRDALAPVDTSSLVSASESARLDPSLLGDGISEIDRTPSPGRVRQ